MKNIKKPTKESQAPVINERPKKYLFCWTEKTEKDRHQFLKFLRTFGVEEETVRFEEIDYGRTINIFSEKNQLSFSLNKEKTKATLTIDDYKTIEYTAKKENGRINIYPKPKINDLVDRWILPMNKYNLKFWIHSTNNAYSYPSLGIGLGTKSKPDIFSFAVLDDDSVLWLKNALNESVEIYKNEKSNSKNADRLILWETKKDLDKLRKISIGLSVVKNNGNKSINLMLNSKAFLYTDLYPDDIEWILTTLSIAKNNLEALAKNE